MQARDSSACMKAPKYTANRRKEHNVEKYIQLGYNASADNTCLKSIFIRLAVLLPPKSAKFSENSNL